MDKNLEAVRRAQVERTIKALAQNRIPAVYAPTREEAVEAVEAEAVEEAEAVAATTTAAGAWRRR